MSNPLIYTTHSLLVVGSAALLLLKCTRQGPFFPYLYIHNTLTMLLCAISLLAICSSYYSTFYTLLCVYTYRKSKGRGHEITIKVIEIPKWEGQASILVMENWVHAVNCFLSSASCNTSPIVLCFDV